MSDIKLTIIIPCYNCSKTIGRLLDSILRNNLKKDVYEVIIVDDKSTDNFLDIVKTYEDRINFVYLTTTREIHCPGNTRQVALEHVKGEWFTFIDNDDMFEDDAFSNVFQFIKETDEKWMIVTQMNEFDDNGELIEWPDSPLYTDTWLHGKYFNKRMITEAGAHFKEDLETHEDIYFNATNLVAIRKMNHEVPHASFSTYKWMYNENSISRSYPVFKGKTYIEDHMHDYVHAATDPFFDEALKNKDPEMRDWCLYEVALTYLHSYFYCQSFRYNSGADICSDIYKVMRDFKIKFMEVFECTELDIIDYFYSNYQLYEDVRQNSKIGVEKFIEIQSLRDFILNS